MERKEKSESVASIDNPNGWNLIPVPVRFRAADLARVIRSRS